MTKSNYQVVAVPKIAYISIQLLQVEILRRGINTFPATWMRDLLGLSRIPGKGKIVGMGIICLSLALAGKTKEEINQMTKEQVIAFLKKNGYVLPPQWGI